GYTASLATTVGGMSPWPRSAACHRCRMRGASGKRIASASATSLVQTRPETPSELLRVFDAHERQSATMPGLRREDSGRVVRHVDLRGHEGVVLYSELTPETADRA